MSILSILIMPQHPMLPNHWLQDTIYKARYSAQVMELKTSWLFQVGMKIPNIMFPVLASITRVSLTILIFSGTVSLNAVMGGETLKTLKGFFVLCRVKDADQNLSNLLCRHNVPSPEQKILKMSTKINLSLKIPDS